MNRFFKNGLLAMIALVGLVNSPVATAAPIYGTVNFGSPVANVQIGGLDLANFVGIPSATVITPANGSFSGSLGSAVTAANITSNGPILGFLSFDGFTVDVASFYGVNVWTVTSLPGGNDFLSMAFTGTIKKAGFDDTAVTGSISTQFTGGYNPNTVVSWSGNLKSEVPEPGTYVLMGAGLVGIFALRRRNG
jgi:hypothetical protein